MEQNTTFANTKTYKALEEMKAHDVIEQVTSCINGNIIPIDVEDITMLETEAMDQGREINSCAMCAEDSDDMEEKILEKKDSFAGKNCLMVVSGNVTLEMVASLADKISQFASSLYFGIDSQREMTDIKLGVVTY